MMFASVRIKNFRAITDLTVDGLGRVNLFVGRNACGKTTLLEGILFLAGPTSPHLLVSVNRNRMLPHVSQSLWPTYVHGMDMDVPIEIMAGESESGREERLVIQPRYEGYRINEEDPASRLSRDLALTGVAPKGQIVGLRLEYTSLSESAAPVVSEVVLRGKELMATSGVKSPSLRGAFIAPCANDWREAFSGVQKQKRVAEVVGLLKEIEPTLADLRLLDPPGFLYADIGAPELIPVNLMGGGMAKFLNVALAMLNLQNGLLLIDEIENGLDLSSQRELWNALFRWAQKLDVQVFATTHSMECIRAFSDGAEAGLFGADAKLFRIERKEDKFRAVEYTREVLAQSLESEWEVR